MSARPTLLTVAFLIGLVALPAHAQQGPTQAELNAAASNAVDWLLTNHDYGGQRFVDAKEITRDNAGSLRAACVYQAADLRPFHTNPLVYRGVMYLTTSQATIALDAATCRVQWRHFWRPKAKENWPQSRGVALKEGIVIRGTSDGYLLALDALTGRLLWERAAADAEKGETFTMPPVVFEDLVIIGPAGNEVPVRGWVGAFRVGTGEPVWRFNTRPAAGEPGAETWSMTEALTGGGAVWTPFSLDATQGLVFVPVGNPAPDYYGDVRQGANLYTNSLVVLDARTGKLVWHYQAVPHDLHDWDLTQVSPLFTAEVNGRARRLVSVVGKDGLLHALDRESREHVYEVAVTRRENVDLPPTPEGVRACPGSLGGVQWNGPAFSPITGLLYVNAIDWCTVFKQGPAPKWVATVPYTGLANGWGTNDPISKWSGWINAVDPKTGKMAWRVKRPTPMYAALTPTAGNVIFTGDLSGNFLVLDARTGKQLYSFDTGGPIAGGVITYEVKGKQYVAVASGHSGGSIPLTGSTTIVIFAL